MIFPVGFLGPTTTKKDKENDKEIMSKGEERNKPEETKENAKDKQNEIERIRMRGNGQKNTVFFTF